jgi:hypothetical protein
MITSASASSICAIIFDDTRDRPVINYFNTTDKVPVFVESFTEGGTANNEDIKIDEWENPIITKTLDQFSRRLNFRNHRQPHNKGQKTRRRPIAVKFLPVRFPD